MFLKEVFAEAREASLRPRDFFGRRPEAESWSAPAARLAFWGFVAGLVDSLVVALGLTDTPDSPLLNVLTTAAFPLFTLFFGVVAAGLLHLAWKLLGGSAPLAASWRAAAAVSFTMPLDIVAGNLGLMSLLPMLFRYWLLGMAGGGVHGLRRGRAWGLVGVLALVELLSRTLS